MISRLALRPLELSNGMTIPAGTSVAVPVNAINRDETVYSNPDDFDGFRFAKLREEEGDTMSSRYTSSENMSFGIGRQKWYTDIASVYDH